MTEVPLGGTALIILLILMVKGFFSLASDALVTSRKTLLRKEAEAGRKGYARALKAAEHPLPLFYAIRIWEIILMIAAGITGAAFVPKLAAVFPFSGGGTLSVAVTIIVLAAAAVVLADLLPRLVAARAPEKTFAAVLPAVRVLTFLLMPAAALLSAAMAGFRRETPGLTEEELRLALREGEKSGVVESRERDMVEGVFYLGDRPVKAFMTHRSEIPWLDVAAGADEVKAALASGDNSSSYCFPVASGTLDQIAGMVYRDDVLLALLDGFKGLRAILRKPRFVPETMSAIKAFEAFKQGDTNYLFVIDEYGGFAGLLYIRDLMEEIVGELSQHSEGEDDFRRRDDGSWIAQGSVPVDDVKAELGLERPAGEYHTLAGLVLSLAGEVPRPGSVIEWPPFRFTVQAMDGNRIDKLKIEKTAAAVGE